MSSSKLKYFCLALLILCHSAMAAAVKGNQMDRYDVTWETPGPGYAGSMPLGNGDIGLNAWVEDNGDLLFYISKTDAWDENLRLVKVGRVRVHFTPTPVIPAPTALVPVAAVPASPAVTVPSTPGAFFRQTLHVGKGEMEVQLGAPEKGIHLTLWVDANHPAVRLKAKSAQPVEMKVTSEVWRTEKRALTAGELHGAYLVPGQYKWSGPAIEATVDPDTVWKADDSLVWFHHNTRSIYRQNLEVQGLGEWADKSTDPLMGLTFGCLAKGPDLVNDSSATLRSKAPSRDHYASFTVFTTQTKTPEEYVEKLKKADETANKVRLKAAREEHEKWWNVFWNRSWIHVPTDCQKSEFQELNITRWPLRIGVWSNLVSEPYKGLVSRVRVSNRVLADSEIAASSSWDGISAPQASDAFLDWMFAAKDLTAGKTFKGLGSVKAEAKPSKAPEFATIAGREGLKVAEGKYLEMPETADLNYGPKATFEAWIAPEAYGARIVDLTMWDNKLYGLYISLLGDGRIAFSSHTKEIAGTSKLPLGQWSHVAATVDLSTGAYAIYVNGKKEASLSFQLHTDVAQGYNLQRYITACAGRGAFPIKFNGTLFNIGVDGNFSDFRAWGGPYWLQNTRLVYWPMLESGDFEMMRPYFEMLCKTLPLAKYRSQKYFGHDGIFLPESMAFWGTYNITDYCWNREGQPISYLPNGAIKRHYVGTLEASAMMLEWYSYTGDRKLLGEVLPFIEEVVGWWDKHYPRDKEGKIVIAPGNALEAYGEVTNPATDVSGMQRVLDQLLALPQDAVGAEKLANWRRLYGEVPALPRGTVNGKTVLLPSKESVINGHETPELYSVFPFRLIGPGSDDLVVARNTYDLQPPAAFFGWYQEPAFAAGLGLAEEARRHVAWRYAIHNADSRFPAFWGPNYDWTPDQDHGGVANIALQMMLLQSQGDKLLLFPAWPKEWDVDFKLHAPDKTTVHAIYRNGKVESLEVSPKRRLKDVVIAGPGSKR